jgi:hypothetical protein
MKSRRAILLLIPILALIVAALAFLALDTGPAHAPNDGGQRSPFRGCTPEEAATRDAVNLIPTPTQYGRSGPDPLYGLRTPNPTFTGRLCDFVLVADPEEANVWKQCTGVRTFYGGDSDMPSPVPSELNWDDTRGQFICDGTPTAVWSEEARRIYFSDEPAVYLGLPREEIAVLEIDGYPVLIGQPPINPSTQAFHALLRLPTANKPGILVSGAGKQKLVDTIEFVRAVLRDSLEPPASPTPNLR